MTQEDTTGLDLAQKIKILINLNKVQYQKSIDETEKLYQPPTCQQAMDYVKKLNVKKEKTFDSIIYTFEFNENDQGGKNNYNLLNQDGQSDLYFIKQPLL